MHDQRHTELNLLGYRIDRVGVPADEAMRYEVIGPEQGAVLARFCDRPAAEQFVVMRELRAVELRPRSPVY